MENSKSNIIEPSVLVSGEELLAALKKRYSDLEQPLMVEKTPWQHGVRTGIYQVIADIESMLE